METFNGVDKLQFILDETKVHIHTNDSPSEFESVAHEKREENSNDKKFKPPSAVNEVFITRRYMIWRKEVHSSLM